MNVFIDVTGSCKSARNTGVQRVTRHIFAALSEQTSVTPICWNRLGNFYHRLGPRERKFLTSPFRNYRSAVGRPEFRGEKFFGEFRRYRTAHVVDLASSLGQGDVLLVPDIYSDQRSERLPAMIRQGQARSVAIFHDAATLRLGLLSKNAADRFRKYARSLAAFDLVICISQESRATLLQLWEQSAIVDLPEVCVEEWPLEFDEGERAAAHGDFQDVILCVGSFDARKNHLKLFEAATRLWDSGLKLELRLVGRSTGAWGYQVEPRLRWLQLRGRPLVWLKHVDDRALHRAYRECKFTVYPSLAEGFGLPILESLWHGKPCLCGRNGALGEVARGGGCLLVDQTSVSALAEGMKRLLTDPIAYEKLSAEARQRNFRSWSDYTSSLREHLQIPVKTEALSGAI